MSGALTRYRIMAYIVGVLLLLLVFVHIPLRLILGIHTPVAVLHGWMFMIYLVTVLDLSLRCKWNIFPRTLLVMLAGTVPFFSFYAEHKATRWSREYIAQHSDTSKTVVSSSGSAPADN